MPRLTDTRQGGLELASQTQNLDFRPLGDGTSLDLSSRDCASTRDREYILDVHQKRLVQITCRQLTFTNLTYAEAHPARHHSSP